MNRETKVAIGIVGIVLALVALMVLVGQGNSAEAGISGTTGKSCGEPTSPKNWLPRATLHTIDARDSSVYTKWSAPSSVSVGNGTNAVLHEYRVRAWIKGYGRTAWEVTSGTSKTWQYSGLSGHGSEGKIRVEVQPCYKWKWAVNGTLQDWYSVAYTTGKTITRPD